VVARRDKSPMTPRRAKILGAIVEEHVDTAAPVGSKAVRERYGVRASTATIRNEMNVLEQAGYVRQPHTSAGRVPEDKGYRTYVDRIMPHPQPTPHDMTWVRSEYRRAMSDTEQLFRTTCRVLAQLTAAPALLLAPPRERIVLASLVLSPVSTHIVRLGYEMQPGERFECLLESPGPLQAQQVAMFAQALARRYCGREIGALSLCTPETLEDELAPFAVPSDLLDGIKSAVEKDRMQRVYIDGSAYALSYPEYQHIDQLRPLVEALDTDGVVRRLLRPASRSGRLTVTIGREHEVRSLRQCSLVSLHYRAAGDAVGALGVLGPTRIDYQAAIAAVRCVTYQIAEALAEDEAEED